MANIKGSSTTKSAIYSGKHSLLPPKSPFPSISSSYSDYVPSHASGTKAITKSKEVNSHHQRTSSESLLLEEQPSWLDELLNEPETPIRRGGHRRSSSDSFAYIDAATTATDYVSQDEYRYKNMVSVPSRGFQELGHHKNMRHASLFMDNPSRKHRNRVQDLSLSSMVHPSSSGLSSARDNAVVQSSGASFVSQELDMVSSTVTEKQSPVEPGPHEPKDLSEKKDSSRAKSSASETETKRAKQQFAQRSRVRKLQYIAELERNVQALQAEGSGVSAELEFLNQQNLILSMENKALKQRVESLAHEQLIKYLEHEVLEREISRLQALYKQQQPQQQQQPQPQPQQQQQQQQQQTSGLRRTKSRDLESQFANLSLQH
ncbi:hypothetical protein NMG60_11036770 [Bertholletia excelsa]